MCSSYRVKLQPTTVKSSRSNSVAEIMHLTIGDMLHTMMFEGKYLPQELDGALQLVAWTILSTISKMSGHTPS